MPDEYRIHPNMVQHAENELRGTYWLGGEAPGWYCLAVLGAIPIATYVAVVCLAYLGPGIWNSGWWLLWLWLAPIVGTISACAGAMIGAGIVSLICRVFTGRFLIITAGKAEGRLSREIEDSDAAAFMMFAIIVAVIAAICLRMADFDGARLLSVFGLRAPWG